MTVPSDQDAEELERKALRRALSIVPHLDYVDEEPRPIDEDYVLELLGIFSSNVLDFMVRVRYALRDGHDLVELADVLHDSLLAVELATGSIR